MLVIVPLPVQEMARAPGPKYSMTRLVPPLTVRMPSTFRITSFGAVQPDISPVKRTPMIVGYNTSHAKPAMTSTASAPPTPTAAMASPPAFGVCESVPIISPPGKA